MSDVKEEKKAKRSGKKKRKILPVGMTILVTEPQE
jgi:hypothetical protein